MGGRRHISHRGKPRGFPLVGDGGNGGEGGVEGEAEHSWHQGVTLFASVALQDCVGVGMLVVPKVRGGGAIQAAQHGQEGGCVWVDCNRRQHGMAGDMIIRSHAINAQDRCAGV